MLKFLVCESVKLDKNLKAFLKNISSLKYIGDSSDGRLSSLVEPYH